jgi:hypothetical protein
MSTMTRDPSLGAGDLNDLTLSQEELANEAGEAAAAHEREMGGDAEAQRVAYDRAHAEVLATAQAAAASTPEPEPEEEVGPAPAVQELVVSGPAERKRKWHGKAPTSVTLKLKGATVTVAEGEFHKGERLQFTGEAVVISEGVKDTLDKDTQQPVEAVQEHTAVVLDFELASE